MQAKQTKHFKNVAEYSCKRIILVTLGLKSLLQNGCYKLHNKLALPLLDGERERSGKSSPLHPPQFLSPPPPLHGTTLPESGHVFLSSGVNENMWHVFFVTWETISTSFHLHHQRTDNVNETWVLNELKALKPEMLENEYSNKTFEILTCIWFTTLQLTFRFRTATTKFFR